MVTGGVPKKLGATSYSSGVPFFWCATNKHLPISYFLLVALFSFETQGLIELGNNRYGVRSLRTSLCYFVRFLVLPDQTYLLWGLYRCKGIGQG